MDEYRWIAELALGVISSIAGWLVGRRQRNNNFLAELQKSINNLAEINSKQMEEILKLRENVITLRSENFFLKQSLSQVQKENESLNLQMAALREENQKLSEQVSALSEQLSGIRTITRK